MVTEFYTQDITPPAAPVISPTSKSFTTPFAVTIASESESSIRYRLGSGTLNCDQGTPYSGTIQIPIGSDLQLRAIACDKLGNLSATSTASYKYIKPAPGEVAPPNITPLSGAYNKII